jgi:LacI family transcriptional regulator
MNGHFQKVSEETKNRVLAIVKQIDYSPSRAGSALRSGRSQIVALLIPDRNNHYNLAIAASLEWALHARGKIMVLCNTDENPAMQDEMLREMRSQLACGIVLLGAVQSNGLRQAIKTGEPVVLVNRRIRTGGDYPFVGVDNLLAAAEIADLFAHHHLSEVTVIHGPLTSSATNARVRGFSRRFLKLDPAGHRIHYHPLENFSKEAGYRVASMILKGTPRPKAIFCTSDEIAYGLARACWEEGVRPGVDVMVSAFDGSPLNEFLTPWLNTVRVDYEAYGPAIVELLMPYWDESLAPGSLERLIPFRPSWVEN